MGAITSACPSAVVLQRLLTDELAGPDRETVELHVEICVTCQAELERLVADTPGRDGSSVVSQPDLEPNLGAAFLSKLKELPMPEGAGQVSPLVPPNFDPQPASPYSPWDNSHWFKSGRLRQYEILGKLGRGGMGAVFKARHVELDKVVALKVLPADQMDEVGIARFKNEIRAIGKLDHPNIVVAQ